MASSTKQPTASSKPAPAKTTPANTRKPASTATNASGQGFSLFKRQGTGPGKFFLGAMIYLFVMEFLQIALVAVNSKYNLHLDSTALFNIFGLKVTWLFVFLIGMAIVVLVILTRLKILPSSAAMMQSPQQSTTAKSGTTAKLSTAAKPTAATSAAPSILPRLFRRSAPASTAAAPAKPTSPKRAAVASTGDAIYDRVRAQQQAIARKRRKH